MKNLIVFDLDGTLARANYLSTPKWRRFSGSYFMPSE